MSCGSLLGDSVDIGLILLDSSGNIRLWNRWIEQRAERTVAQATGLTLARAFGDHIDPRVVLVVREALDFGWSARLSHALASFSAWERTQRAHEAIHRCHPGGCRWHTLLSASDP